MSGENTHLPQQAGDVAVHCAHDRLVELSSLRPNPANPNRHPARQIELLAKIIAAQGWRNPIVVSMRSGLVVKGHGRLEAARLIGVETVPVDFQEYGSAEDETADLLADNRIAELAEMNEDGLKALLLEVSQDGFDVELTGYDSKEIDRLLSDLTGQNDVEPKMAQAEALRKKWGVKVGQLWKIGRHRLVCGDSTNPDHVALCLGGGQANAYGH